MVCVLCQPASSPATGPTLARHGGIQGSPADRFFLDGRNSKWWAIDLRFHISATAPALVGTMSHSRSRKEIARLQPDRGRQRQVGYSLDAGLNCLDHNPVCVNSKLQVNSHSGLQIGKL